MNKIEFIFSKNFDKNKMRITKIYKKNTIKNELNHELLFLSIIVIAFFSCLSSLFISLLNIGFVSFFFYFSLYFSLYFVFYKRNDKKSENLKNKFNQKKYDFLKYSKFKILINRLENEDYDTIIKSKDLIFNNINIFNYKERNEIIKLLNERIDMEENSLIKLKNRIENIDVNIKKAIINI